jgi:hypothetical protein
MPLKAFVEGCASAVAGKAAEGSDDKNVGGHKQYGTFGQFRGAFYSTLALFCAERQLETVSFTF